MVCLRNFTGTDARILAQRRQKKETKEEILAQISSWNTREHQGRYFEMFAVVYEREIVGAVSILETAKHIVSIGPEIFSDFKRHGFGKAAVTKCMEIAKDKGYFLAMQQIREDNDASIALHKSLEFETDGYVYRNRRGNPVLVFVKVL